MMEAWGNDEEFDKKLSRTLEVLGLSEAAIKHRIDKCLQTESRLNDFNRNRGLFSVYIGGSRGEGLGLPSMNADNDWMLCMENYNIITDTKDWQSDKVQFFTDSDVVYPGYTRLRPMRGDLPLFFEPSDTTEWHPYIRDNFVTDGSDFFLSTKFCFSPSILTSRIHGPANTTSFMGFAGDIDTVYCLRCKSWPLEARGWITRRRLSDWPSGELLQILGNESCLLVPVSSAISQQRGIEWRYSFSLVERKLINSWTNKQSKCYVLLKMLKDEILTTNPQCERTLCSYHLKTIMFWVSESKGIDWWKMYSLSQCFMFCLYVLHQYLIAGVCCSYFIPDSNLFHSFQGTAQQRILIGVVGGFLIEGPKCLMRCEVVANQLAMPSEFEIVPPPDLSVDTAHADVMMDGNIAALELMMSRSHRKALLYLIAHLGRLEALEPSSFANICLRSSIPIAKATLGSTAFALIKSCKLPNRLVYALNSCAKRLLEAGTSGDVSSGKLKLANYYFNLGSYRKSVDLLERIAGALNPHIIPGVISASPLNVMELNSVYIEEVMEGYSHLPFDQQLQRFFQQIVAWPIFFSFAEISCTPKPLVIEMFKRNRCPSNMFDAFFSEMWNFAAVDSFVMTYFLQFMCYKKLRKPNHMRVALSNLKWAALDKPDLNYTRDTALNLVGYCYSQLGDLDNALKYFVKSLRVNSLMNVAYIHVALLLAKALRR